MKNVIVATWLKTGEVEVFSSLKRFVERNPAFKESTITNYLSRKKVPYANEVLHLQRLPFIRERVS
jgi:hypothetical protein